MPTDQRFLISIPPRARMDRRVLAASALACRRALAASIAASMMLGGLRLAEGGALRVIGLKWPGRPVLSWGADNANDSASRNVRQCENDE